MKILIVEDSYLLQFRLSKALSVYMKTANLRQAMNCKDALDIFTLFKPEAVILDIDLPDGSGIDLIPKFIEKDPEVRLIIFTSYQDEVFRKKCLSLGAYAFYEKSQVDKMLKTIGQLKTDKVKS